LIWAGPPATPVVRSASRASVSASSCRRASSAIDPGELKVKREITRIAAAWPPPLRSIASAARSRVRVRAPSSAESTK